MLTPRSLARLACSAVLATAATACTTHRSVEDNAMQRAYEITVPVTGSRILRKIDPATGMPNVGYPITTLKGDSARAMLRNMPTLIDARN